MKCHESLCCSCFVVFCNQWWHLPQGWHQNFGQDVGPITVRYRARKLGAAIGREGGWSWIWVLWTGLFCEDLEENNRQNRKVLSKWRNHREVVREKWFQNHTRFTWIPKYISFQKAAFQEVYGDFDLRRAPSCKKKHFDQKTSPKHQAKHVCW